MSRRWQIVLIAIVAVAAGQALVKPRQPSAPQRSATEETAAPKPGTVTIDDLHQADTDRIIGAMAGGSSAAGSQPRR